MKRFDAQSIKTRLLDRLRVKREWSMISENGTLSALLDTFADGLSEVSRYGEYLLSEKKWNTAQNLTSLVTQTDLIGRKTKRQRSAVGYAIVSHTDDTGTNRLANLGTAFFDLDAASDYDNLVKDENNTVAAKAAALVPWTFDTPYMVAKGTRLITSGGIEFIVTETVSSRTLKESWDSISRDPEKLENFYAEGGWDGIKYVRVPVIQGKQKTYSFGTATGARFESFKLPLNNCENASNYVSKQLLNLYVINESGTRVRWVQTPNILLAGPYDNVFEVTNMPDYSGVIFKVGNGITGSKLPVGLKVEVEYIETLGSAGNVESKYQIQDIVAPVGKPMIDPRTQSAVKFLSATNVHPILGGTDVESEESLRTVAPVDYLQHYSIATTKAYETQIEELSQIGLSKVKVFSGTKVFDLIQAGNPIQNAVYFTAISNNGGIIEDATNSLVKPLMQSLNDLKAPGDIFTYIDPELIKLRLGITIYSTDNSQDTDTVISTMKQAIFDKYYSINREFKQPFRESDLVSLVASFPYVTYTNIFVEALAYTYPEKAEVVQYKTAPTRYPPLVSIPFKFSTVYSGNLYNNGFKNHSQDVGALLRVDIKFLSGSASAAQNRTFFLYDHRNNLEASDDILIEQGYMVKFDGSDVVTNNAPLDWHRPLETLDTYPDRACRVAQFPFISAITDEEYMVAQVKNSSKTPYEIRPYVVGLDGRNVLYNVDDYPDQDITGSDIVLVGDKQFYRKDSRYTDYVNIAFTEYYDEPSRANYASGSLTVPVSFFNFDGIISSTGIISEDGIRSLRSDLANLVEIKVTAQPILLDIELDQEHQLMYVENDDIQVERISIQA